MHKGHPTTHPFKRERFAVATALAFIFIVPELGFNLAWLILPLLLLGLAALGALAIIEKDRTDLVIVLVSAAAYIGVWIFFPEIHPVLRAARTSSSLSFLWLTVTFLIGPWSHLTKRVQPIYHERRHFGVAAFFFGLLHFHFVFKYYFGYDPQILITSPFTLASFIGLVLMSVLAATSTEYAHNKIPEKIWNWIFNSCFAFLLLAWILQLGLGTFAEPLSALTLPIFYLIFAAFAPYGLPRKILRTVSGWKQVHMLMWVIYILITIHALIAFTSFYAVMPAWAAALIGTGFLAVFCTHAAGWVVMLVQRIRQGRLGHDQVVIDGLKYYAVSPVKDFQDGKGRKFVIGGNPVAVFKIGDDFRALSSICPHQAGPMEDGEIIGNVVQCPLHDWQFNVDDGSPGPNALECLPSYPTAVQNDLVFVGAQSSGRCSEVNGHFFFNESPESE
jgi:nitrite reductase (NADH) small subunit